MEGVEKLMVAEKCGPTEKFGYQINKIQPFFTFFKLNGFTFQLKLIKKLQSEQIRNSFFVPKPFYGIHS